jgi:FkbM family methyltransferase
MYDKFHGEITSSSRNRPVDAIIREYFPDYSYHGIFFEIGAYRPIQLNNSYHFEKNNWSTYCIEPNIKVIDELKSERKNVLNYAMSNSNADDVDFTIVYADEVEKDYMPSFTALEIDSNLINKLNYNIKKSEVIKVKVRTLDWILENETKDIDHIDVITIDTEGGEENVLKGFCNLNFYPKLFVVEQHFDNQFITNFMKINNYKLDKAVDYNYFYWRDNV